MSRRGRSAKNFVWECFIKNEEEFGPHRAQCRYCSNVYSYVSTSHNLVTHLLRKHKNIFVTSEFKNNKNKKERDQRIRDCFTAIDGGKVACNICDVTCVLEIHILAFHLKSKHSDIYETISEKSTQDDEFKQLDLHEKESEADDSPDTSKPTVCVEQDSEGRLRCSVCRASLEDAADAIKHMEEDHPKIAIDETFDDDDDRRDTDDDMFTEVVYLDDHDPIKVKDDNTNKGRITIRTPKKRQREVKRRDSTSSDDDYLRRIKAKYDEEARRKLIRRGSVANSSRTIRKEKPQRKFKKISIEKASSDDDVDATSNEVQKFTTYITCLLKTVNRDTLTKLQMDIVNLIMKAKLKETQSLVIVEAFHSADAGQVDSKEGVIPNTNTQVVVNNKSDIEIVAENTINESNELHEVPVLDAD